MAEDMKALREKMRNARKGPSASGPTDAHRPAARPVDAVPAAARRPADEPDAPSRSAWEEGQLDYAERLKKQISDANAEYQRMRRDDPNFDHQKTFDQVSQKLIAWENANAEEAKEYELEGAWEPALTEMIAAFEPGNRVRDAVGTYNDLRKGDKTFSKEDLDVAAKDLTEPEKQMLEGYLTGKGVPKALKTLGDNEDTDSDKPASATEAERAAAKTNRLGNIRTAREFLRETYGRYDKALGIEGPEGNWWAGPTDTAIVVTGNGVIWKLKPGQSYNFGRETANWKLWQGHGTGWKDVSAEEAQTSGKSEVEVILMPADFAGKEPLTKDEPPKDVPAADIETKARPDGIVTPVFSRQFIKKGDEYTHVLYGDEWEPIQDGDPIPAYDKAVLGKILIKNGRTVAEFIPNAKANDDTKEDDTKKPPKSKAEIEALRQKIHNKWDRRRGRKGEEDREDEKYDFDRVVKTATDTDWDKRMGPWNADWRQPVDQERPLQQIPPPRPVAPLTKFFRRLFGVYERDPILEQQLNGAKSEAEKAEIRAREALTLGSLGIGADAQDRSLKEQWLNVRKKLHLEGVARSVLIGGAVIAILSATAGIGALTLGSLGGIAAGKIARNFIEGRQKKDGETGKLATFKRFAGSSIIGIGAGVAIGLATGSLDWSGIWDRLTGGGVPDGSSDVPSPETSVTAISGGAPPGFDTADFGRLGNAAQLCDPGDNVWSIITDGMKENGLLNMDNRGSEAFAHAFQRTIEQNNMQGLLLETGGKVLNGPDFWRHLPDGTMVRFDKVFGNPEFVEKFSSLIEKNYPSLVDRIHSSGWSVNQFIKGYAYMHGVRIP